MLLNIVKSFLFDDISVSLLTASSCSCVGAVGASEGPEVQSQRQRPPVGVEPGQTLPTLGDLPHTVGL